MINSVIAWLIAFIVSAAGNKSTDIPEAKETRSAALVRYESIATDVADVVWRNKPLFPGTDGRLQTAALIVSTMRFEGSFRKDVDTGAGKLSKGDHEKSVCLMQIHVGKKRTTPWNFVRDRFAVATDPSREIVQGWNAKELLADRKKCIEAGYRIMSESFHRCSNLPLDGRMRAYVSGSCTKGVTQSHNRIKLAHQWYKMHKPYFDDALAMQILHTKLPTDPFAPVYLTSNPWHRF